MGGGFFQSGVNCVRCLFSSAPLPAAQPPAVSHLLHCSTGGERQEGIAQSSSLSLQSGMGTTRSVWIVFLEGGGNGSSHAGPPVRTLPLSAQGQICLEKGHRAPWHAQWSFPKTPWACPALSGEPRLWRQEDQDTGEVASHALLARLS